VSALTILAVGDIMLGDSPQVFGFGVASSIRKHGTSALFEQVKPRLCQADLTIANLEVVVSSPPAGAAFGERIYRGETETLPTLREAGIDVVTVCTNHTMQHGQAAFDACMVACKAAGLRISGADSATAGIQRTLEMDVSGRRVCVLSYNLRPVQYRTAPPAWPSPTRELMTREVAKASARADVVLVTLHWGDEFIEYPSPDQVAMAHALVDAGADVIIGHHPHIVQGIERYNGAVIAYSLGNFVFDQWQPRLRRSLMLELHVHGRKQVDYTVHPTVIGGRYAPEPCEGELRQRELEHHRRLAALIGVHDTDAYRAELDTQYKRFRKEILMHYLTKFWKFNPVHYLQNIAEIVRRRL